MIKLKPIQVLGFDGWTQGIHHYTRLLSVFNQSNIELKVIHYGSWGEDINRPIEENIDGLVVRDIKYYKTNSFKKILECENPDIVLFLSTESFTHQAFQRYCYKLKIPTVHLFHGLFGVIPIENGINAYKINLFRQFVYLFERSKKFFKKTLYIYSRSLLETNASYKDWLKFGKDLLTKLTGKLIVIPAMDSKATRCCVYTKADCSIVNLKWKYNAGEVIVVGNPDLERFGLEESQLGSALNPLRVPKQIIVYIDSGLSSHGFNFSSDENYLKYLKDCSQVINLRNYVLYVKIKPHPKSRYDYLVKNLQKNGIGIIDNNDFTSILSSSTACIIEPSTASLIPCLLGLPVFLTQVGQLNSLLYGDLFRNYPRGTILKDWQELPSDANLPFDEKIIDKTNEWIADNVGPLPSSEMPLRVASLIVELYRSKKNE
jgi:hypothetical protein